MTTPQTIQEAVTAYVAHLAASGKAPTTVAAYGVDLAQLAARLEAEGVTDPAQVDTAALRRYLGTGEAGPATLRRKMSAARGFFLHLAATGLIPANPAAALSHSAVPAPRPPADDDVRRMLNAAPYGTRERALLELFAMGVRSSEAFSATMADYDSAQGTLTIGGGTRCLRRTLNLSATAIMALDAWLSVRPYTDPHGPNLLIPNSQGAHLTRHTVAALLRKLKRKAGVNVTGGALRRHRAATLREMDLDWEEVAAQLGHRHAGTSQFQAGATKRRREATA